MFQSMMQNILELVQSDPEMLSTLTQRLVETSGGAEGAATTEGGDQQSTLAARPEEVVIVRYYLKSAHSASLNYFNYVQFPPDLSPDNIPEMMMRLMRLTAAVQAGSSETEEAAAVTEDVPSNEETSGGEGGEGRTGTESGGSPATGEEDQQPSYLSLGARPKTRQDKK